MTLNRWQKKQSLAKVSTLFLDQKWHSSLVTLNDRKLQVFKISPKLTIIGIFNELLSTKNENGARFARNVRLFYDFQTLCIRSKVLYLFNCSSFQFITGEVRALYRSFKQECPNGIVNEETFKEVYEKIFPLGDASRYAHLVFCAIDR